MYSATFGMLWSGCTSTFMPFFRVRVLTGNPCDCDQAGEAAIPKRHNHNKTRERYQIAFIYPPSDKPFLVKTQANGEMFAVLPGPLTATARTRGPVPRTTFQLDGRHNEEC